MDSIQEPKAFLLKKIAVYVTKIFQVFGLIEGPQEFGFPKESNSTGLQEEEVLKPYLDALTKFRTDVRRAAKDKKDYNHFYTLADELRKKVAEQGVKIVDDDPVLSYSFVGKEKLLKELEEQERAKEEKTMKQKQTKLEAKKKQLEECKKKATPASQLVKELFNVDMTSEEVPEKDLQGNEILQSKRKKIKSTYNAQVKKNVQWAEQEKKEVGILGRLEAEIKDLEEELAAYKKEK